MKVAIVVLCSLFVAFAAAVDNQGTCGGSCTSSAACASGSGNVLCRCVNFVCSMTEQCGGGCLTDSQCANWGGSDSTCVCTWAFKCETKNLVDAPGYSPFIDLVTSKQAKQPEVLPREQ